MSKFKVLITDYAWPDLSLEKEIIEAAGGGVVESPDSSPQTLRDLAADVSAIMTCWADVPASVIDAAQHCRIVSRFGIGLDNIDVDHCTKLGIPVTNVPDYCLVEVAEHALGLIFCLARSITRHHHLCKQAIYDLDAGLPLCRVAGKTLGIVGFGKIGRALSDRASAIGMRVITTSRKANIRPAESCQTLDDLLGQSDFVSLHLPLNRDTYQQIGEKELRSMKSNAFLINTARGGLIDHEALEKAVCQEWIRGAALDVHDPEPPDLRRPLYQHPRVIATPHSAFVSEQSVRDLRTLAAAQVVARMTGQIPDNVVNPSTL